MKTTKKPRGPVPAAFGVLCRVFSGGYADILLDAELKRLSPESRPLTTETVYGVLRHCIRIDWIIDSVSRIKTKKMETKVLSALRIGVYQLLFLSRVPAFAAINESVKLIKGAGAKKAGFVNALLRKVGSIGGSFDFPDPEKEPVKYASVYYSHPEWMVKRWAAQYGMEGAARLCEANLLVPPKTIRVNTLVTSGETLARELAQSGFAAASTEYSPVALNVTGIGRLPPGDLGYYIQDEASQLVAYLLAPASGETVLDACAAPGGKASHIAALMENTGVLYALDKSQGRARVLSRTLKAQKATMAMVINADAGAPLCFKGPPGTLCPPSHGLFDAILVDAPCSGLGVLGRSPDIKLRRTEADLADLSKRQARLLDNLAGYLKKGGRMVYSVCTLEPEETDTVIEGFLKRHKDFELQDASGFLPQSCAPLVDGYGFLRTLPHLHHTDGFFAARLGRTG